MLISFVVYSHQQALSDNGFQFEKRRIDGHARTSIPLFRGSNLGIFVRKRPYAAIPEHSIIRKDAHSALGGDENVLAEALKSNEHYRRFDDYSENPGPMFGR